MLQKIFRRGRIMRLGLTIVLSGVGAVTPGISQSQAKPFDPPVLSVVLDDAITQPGNLRLIRPLVLFIADWSSQSPRARAWTNTGIVTAEIRRIPGSPDHWNASVKYTVAEAPDAKPGSGALTLHLTIKGATVFGSFEGRFRDLQVHGAARAGLTWDLTTDMRHGMLLWLPDPARPARAALLWGGDKHSALREDLQAFAAANNLALVGMEGFDIAMAQRDGPLIEGDLKTLGEMSGHTELSGLPILFTGHSIGGQIAYEFNAWKPERVIAFTVSKGGRYETWEAPAQARANPAVLCAGEIDTAARVASINRLFTGNRPLGAFWSLETEEGLAHEFGRSVPLFLVHFQHALDQRLPPGAAKILPVDQKRAWLADNSTWHDGVAKIFPAAGFKGDPARLSWLLDADVAYVYRGAATYANPLVLARTAGHAIQYYADEPVVLECADFGDGQWKSVVLYDGSLRLATLSREKPRVTLKPQKLGAHAGVLIGEGLDGSLRTSWPVAWVVRPD